MKRTLSNNALKAVGEELVKYQLLARGWEVFNLNTISHNHPNADLLAVKGKTLVRIQVKTSQYKDWVQLGWIVNGRTNVNGKTGDPADFFAMVGHVGPDDYSIHIIPAAYLADWEKRSLETHSRHGRSQNAGYVYFGSKVRKTKFSINENGDEFAPFRNAWHLLAGDGGGEIVAAGPPKEIVKEERSYTGQFLKPVLGRKVARKKGGAGAGAVEAAG